MENPMLTEHLACNSDQVSKHKILFSENEAPMHRLKLLVFSQLDFCRIDRIVHLY